MAAGGTSFTQHQLVTSPTFQSTETPSVPALVGTSFSDLLILTQYETYMYRANLMQVCSHCFSVNLLDQKFASHGVILTFVVFEESEDSLVKESSFFFP